MKKRKEPAAVDAAAVSRITGVATGTTNMWVQRGLIPGMSVTTQGKARSFDLDTALHIAVMGALGRLGYAAPFAAMAAAEARNGFDRPGATLVVAPPRKGAYGLGVTPAIYHVEAGSPGELEDFLDGLPDGRPEAYTLVELDRLGARVRKAFLDPDPAERARRQRGVPERRSVREKKQ